jgi:site-specific DNA-methyltransferase (adenine-specific)
MIDLRLGDSLEVLKTLPENSVDSLVTDPPYGWRFMGKAWDAPDIEATRVRDCKNPDKDTLGMAAGKYEQTASANRKFQEWTEAWAREVFRVLKPGAHALVFCGPRTYHRMASGLEDAGFEIRDQLQWLFGSGFPKSLDISKAIDKMYGAEREVVGIKQKWQGWGTALKPANEPICLARKPLSEDTVAKNVLKWGTGGLNIDQTRIKSDNMPKSCTNQNIKNNSYGLDNAGRERDTVYNPSNAGRFPSNLLLSHSHNCTEDACDMFECAVRHLDEQSSDAGGASRFFYCAKVSSRERNQGCKESEDGVSVKNAHPT